LFSVFFANFLYWFRPESAGRSYFHFVPAQFFLVIFLQQQAPVFLCSFSQAVDVALVFHCLRSIIGSGLFSRFHFFGSRVKDAPGGFAASRVISFFPA
jgi:hypothetical protein